MISFIFEIVGWMFWGIVILAQTIFQALWEMITLKFTAQKKYDKYFFDIKKMYNEYYKNGDIDKMKECVESTKGIIKERFVLKKRAASLIDKRDSVVIDMEKTIQNIEQAKMNIEQARKKFENNSKELQYTYMFENSDYGKVNEDFYNSVKALNGEEVDNIINRWSNACSNKYNVDYLGLSDFTPRDLAMYLWYYALSKPFSMEKFNVVVSLYDKLIGCMNVVEPFIAEMYYTKQIDGKNLIMDTVRGCFSAYARFAYWYNQEDEIAEQKRIEVTQVASALRWMGAYEAERLVLERMFIQKFPMSHKLQERLHSLNNNSGKAPKTQLVESTEGKLFFEVSSVDWKEEEYRGFFENLLFEEKTLEYSLAVRDEDKELTVMKKMTMIDETVLFDKIKSNFDDEYGDEVELQLCDCEAIADSHRERLRGILVRPMQCAQMGILIHITNLGKKFNIKFYTLFMPISNDLDEQKQQVLSIAKKMSPTVNVWESSMKDNVLIAIQQLLNEMPECIGDIDEGEVEF